jgi:hypothetical protein
LFVLGDCAWFSAFFVRAVGILFAELPPQMEDLVWVSLFIASGACFAVGAMVSLTLRRDRRKSLLIVGLVLNGVPLLFVLFQAIWLVFGLDRD